MDVRSACIATVLVSAVLCFPVAAFAKNHDPRANNDAITTAENTPVTINVLANDSDSDGDPIHIDSITDSPGNGTAAIVSGQIKYTPDPGFSGTDTFRYRIRDDHDNSDRGTVTVTVTEADNGNPPSANNDTASTEENTAVSIDVKGNDTDPDGDTLSITIVSDPAHGTTSIASGEIQYTPDTDYTGTDSFSYTISDGNGNTDSANVSVTVTSAGEEATPTSAPAGARKQYSIVSVGVVGGETKVITLEGVQRKTWADYALWSDDNRNIYFKSGEKFNGKVHSNTELWFSGDPEFFERVTSAAASFGGSTNSCTFHKDFITSAPTQTMATVNFSNLYNKASIVYTGTTYITVSGTNMIISNDRAGLSTATNPIPPDGVIYVETATTGASATRPGDVFISGTLDGRITVATEHNINITNHLEYAVDAKTNAACNDALGLISMHDVVVKTSCPDDVRIYAHIMATGLDTASDTDGSFGVEDYSSGSPRGQLIVHGGIAQAYRGAVGTFSTSSGAMVTGYEKNYTYDTRFMEDPPPEYPPLSDELRFGLWREE